MTKNEEKKEKEDNQEKKKEKVKPLQRRRLLLIALVSLLAFTPTLFRTLPYGMDSFYFLEGVCQKKGLEQQPIASQIAFYALPCNITALKLLFFACCVASAFFAAKLATLFTQKGWLAGILVFASPIWILEFWKIENDGLAYPIIFAGTWLFFKGLKNNGLKTKLAGLGLVSFSFLLWEGAGLWLIALGTSWIWTMLPTLIVITTNTARIARQIMPKLASATENLPAFGLLYQTFLLIGLLHIKKIPTLIPATIIMTSFAFLNAKFAIHATFLLAVYATKAFDQKDSVTKYMLLGGTAMVILFTASMALSLPPDSQEVSAAGLAVALAEGETICNDWGTGHLLSYLGGKPLARSGGRQICQGCNYSYELPEHCVILSYRDFNCAIVNDANNDTDLRVYQC